VVTLPPSGPSVVHWFIPADAFLVGFETSNISRPMMKIFATINCGKVLDSSQTLHTFLKLILR
jgi:hypothetical protein